MLKKLKPKQTAGLGIAYTCLGSSFLIFQVSFVELLISPTVDRSVTCSELLRKHGVEVPAHTLSIGFLIEVHQISLGLAFSAFPPVGGTRKAGFTKGVLQIVN